MIFESNNTKLHPIQKHIYTVLHSQRVARFRDLRPKNVDSNLCSYHLSLLRKQGIVERTSDGYRLSQIGMHTFEYLSQNTLTKQPKIMTTLVIQNSEGDILLHRRQQQPYLGYWSLPYGGVHHDDASMHEAVSREVREKIGSMPMQLEYAGDAYVRVRQGDGILSSSLTHVFRAYCDDIEQSDDLAWARPHKLGERELVPGTEEIMTRTFFRDAMFFEEFTIEPRAAI